MVPKALLAAHLQPVDKIVFAGLAANQFGGVARISSQALADSIWSCKRQVIRSLRRLEQSEFITPIPAAARQPKAYRLNDAIYGWCPESAARVQQATTAEKRCVKCARRCRAVNAAALCRGCAREADFVARLKAAQIELGPAATPEELAMFLHNSRLAAKIRKYLMRAA